MFQSLEATIAAVLRSRLFFHLSALLLTQIFWWSGLSKLGDFQGAQAEMAHFGLQPATLFAALTIAVQLGGSAAIVIGGRLAWLGAGALSVFTLATIPLAHRFWEMEGVVAFLEKALVQEHLTVIGGLLLAAVLAETRRSGMPRS